jgi:hypothetical protein
MRKVLAALLILVAIGLVLWGLLICMMGHPYGKCTEYEIQVFLFAGLSFLVAAVLATYKPTSDTVGEE